MIALLPTPVPGRLRRRALRAGVTLVEIAIVVAIFGIMSALAAQSMVGMLPSWRTRRAAREFMADVQKARDLAIAEGVEYRVRIGTWDTSPGSGDASVGSYYIERGNLPSGSTDWDILPIDDGAPADGEGTIDFSRTADNALPWVSLQEPAVQSITFDGRGFLRNSSSEFDSTGMISFVFFNKRALVVDGVDEAWTVSVSRAGFARLIGTHSDTIGSPPGTSGVTSYATSSGSGYAP